MKLLYPSLLAIALIITPALTPEINFAYAKEKVSENSPSAHIQVNINEASAEQLTELRGIGQKKAEAIIEYRNSYGPFNTLNDLTNVKGIGAKFIEKNSQYLKI